MNCFPSCLAVIFHNSVIYNENQILPPAVIMNNIKMAEVIGFKISSSCFNLDLFSSLFLLLLLLCLGLLILFAA